MESHAENLSRFVGGQVEVRGRNFVYRGEIMKIARKGGNLIINPAWIAKGKHGSQKPPEWIKWEIPSFLFCEESYEANTGEKGRIEFFDASVDVRITFYLPGDEPLSRDQVQGLDK